jgi:predicted PurR-regulated permease PerM
MQTIQFSPRAKRIALWIVVVVTLVLLYAVRDVAVPFFWALIAAYVFHPLIKKLYEKTKVPRAIWIILLYLVAFALIGWAIAVLVPLVENQYNDLVEDVPDIISSVQTFVRENSRLDFYGFSVDLQAISNEVISMLGGLARSLPGQALVGITLVFGTVFKIVIFLVATFHLLLFGERWVGAAVGLLPPPLQAELLPVFGRIHQTMGAYLRVQLIRIGGVSIIVYIVLSILQVRFALVLAIMAGILDIVPMIGPTVSSAVTVLVALVQPTTPFGWSHITLALATVILYIGLNQLEENILLPPLIGYMVDLPPLVVLFVVLVGERLAGLLGLLLAVPIAASTKIVLRYVYAKLTDQPVVLDDTVTSRQRRPRLPLRKLRARKTNRPQRNSQPTQEETALAEGEEGGTP